MKNDDIVVALDFGSTKITTVVASQSSDGEEGEGYKVLGVGISRTSGLKKGFVSNIEETVTALSEAIDEAEISSGVKITSAVIGIAGPHIQGINSSGVAGIKGREVNAADVKRVIDTASALAIPNDRMPLHVIPQEYRIDSQDEIRDPLGMVGTRLEAKVHIVTASRSAIQNLVRCCHRAGVHASEIVLQSLATSELLLTQDEKELGVAVVDIGGGTSDFAIFSAGSLVHTGGIALGGIHLTHDLAIGLRTPQSEAEKLKLERGCGIKQFIDEGSSLEINPVGGGSPRIIQQKILGEILEPRLEEILGFLKKEILHSGYLDKLGAGIVFTGGTTLLPGAIELAERVFDLPVKRAQPSKVEGLSADYLHPSFSSVLGLVEWTYAQRKMGRSKRKSAVMEPMIKAGKQLKSWFQELV
ncbi:MAG: cell division protein FtsA [Bdellovibrionota bacterium]